MPQTKKKPSGLFVFVPAFNEEATLEKVLRDLVALKNAGRIQGICVVNDGSTDGTAKIANRFRKEGVEVSHHVENVGKGKAFFNAAKWAEAKGAKFLAMFDADLEGINEKDFLKLRKAMRSKKISMAIGAVRAGDKQLPFDVSGQRVIRMSALKPLLIGNKNWVHLISGIDKRTGKTERRGYGIETALNYLLGTVLSKHWRTGLPAPTVKFVKTGFSAAPISRISRGIDIKQTQVGDMFRVDQIIRKRREGAKQKMEKRKERTPASETISTNKATLKCALRHRLR